jgi:hypothetical protein
MEAVATAARAAERITARPSTLGSPAAGITAAITAGGAVSTVATTSSPLKEGWELLAFYFVLKIVLCLIFFLVRTVD